MIWKHLKNKIVSICNIPAISRLSYFSLTALDLTEGPDYLGGSWVEHLDASTVGFLLHDLVSSQNAADSSY